jgi:hypothetical protein
MNKFRRRNKTQRHPLTIYIDSSGPLEGRSLQSIQCRQGPDYPLIDAKSLSHRHAESNITLNQ